MDPIKPLFFNDTLKRWHFEELVQSSGMSRERVHHFLRELCKEGFIKRIKPRGKMPYYLAKRDSLKFRSEKRLYGLSLLEEAGLFEHIASCKGIKTAILFGSFARGDWSRSSDIDIFIFGDDSEFDKRPFESKLERKIQIFSYTNPKEMKHHLDPKVITNIAKGFHLTESFEPFEVAIHA